MKLLSIIIIAATTFAACSYSNDYQTAERDAERFVSKFAKDPKSPIVVECAQLDTDLDGYCSCTASVDGKTMALQCGCPRHAQAFHFDSWFNPKTELRGCRLDRYINRNVNFDDDGNAHE